MKRFSVILLTVLSLSILLSSSTFAQKGTPKKDQVKERIFDKLDLSETQINEIEKLRYDHQMQMIDLQSDLKKNKLELKNLFDNDEINENAIMNIVEENNGIHNKMAVMRAEMMIKMNSVLTPEQRARVKGMPIFDMGPRHGRGMGPHMGRGFSQGKNFGKGNNFRQGLDNDYRCRFRNF